MSASDYLHTNHVELYFISDTSYPQTYDNISLQTPSEHLFIPLNTYLNDLPFSMNIGEVVGAQAAVHPAADRRVVEGAAHVVVLGAYLQLG